MPDRPNNVIKQIAALKKMKTPELKERWRVLFGGEPPGYNRVLLIKRLAYRIQELAYGGLSNETRQRMDNLLDANGFDDIGRTDVVKSRVRHDTPIAGTRLIRTWEGEDHEVLVLRKGFEYRGKPYKSLSAIARAITGSRWNGPLFFGLRKQHKKKRKVEEAND